MTSTRKGGINVAGTIWASMLAKPVAKRTALRVSMPEH